MSDRFLPLLVDLHRDLRRLGPGDDASTRRALDLCAPHLPAAPDVLDLGCGAGAQTLLLATETGGSVTAADLHAPMLASLRRRAVASGLDGSIRTVQADMADLPFDPATFDLVWSEGAIYIVGFDRGLDAWRALLRPGGCLAVTELSWLSDARPPGAVAYWDTGYPAMRSIEANVAAAEAAGYEVLGAFPLPDRAWTEEYYRPLRARLDPFLAAHEGDPVAAAVVSETRREMAMYERFGAVYGYVFYVLRALTPPRR